MFAKIVIERDQPHPFRTHSARVQSRICPSARHMWWCGGACSGHQLWVAQWQPQPQGTLAGLHWCQRAAAAEAVVTESCLETLGLDTEGNMNKLGYTGQNHHAWDASSCPMSAWAEGYENCNRLYPTARPEIFLLQRKWVLQKGKENCGIC